MVIFKIPSFLLHLIVGFFNIRKTLLHLYSLFFFDLYRFMASYCVTNLSRLLFILMFCLLQICTVAAPLTWLLGPFGTLSPLFEHFLILWHSKMFWVHLVLSEPFLPGALIAFSGEWCLETKTSMYGMLITTEISFFL